MDDIAFHPHSGRLFGLANSPYPSHAEKLFEINVKNGKTSYQATLFVNGKRFP